MAITAAVAPAWAQDTSAAEATQPAEPQYVDDIIVTAQRREERVQDIPVAISAFGSEQLERTGVVTIENIAPRVPSFYFGSFGPLRPQLYIRGIGTRSFDPGSESSVGVFQDEVYLGRSSGSFGALKDVERVEVLRGPQGTLYGRNTIGGAINIITKGPTDTFTGDFEAGISNFNGWEVFGAVGGPITKDGSVMFRVAGWHTERDGYVTNLTTGNKFQGIDNSGGRVRLAFAPSDSFRIDLTGEYLHDGDKGAFAGVNQGTGRSAAGAPPNPNAIFFAAASRLPFNQLPPSLTRARWDRDPFLNRDAYSGIAKIEGDLGFATLTSVSSYRKLDVRDGRDLEGSSLDVLFQSSNEESEQFTQEFRLTSNPNGPASFDGKLDWIVGGFYYNDKSARTDVFRVGVDSAVRAAVGTPATDTAFSDYKIESYAVFGQLTAHLGKLDVTLGGRYTKDTKSARQTGATTDALPIIPVAFDTTNRAEYDSFDPRLVLTYNISNDVNVYASYSTGFKSGGFQYVPFNLPSANTLFNPEDITTYELGFKSEFLNRALRLNVAAYYYDYKDLQVSRIIDTPSGPQTLISNAASSTIKGLDVELLLRPTRNIDFSINYGYLDAKYDNYVFNLGQNLVFNDTVLVRAPEHTINVGAEWRLPVAGGGLTLRADYALLDTFYHEPGQGNPIYGSGIPLTREPGYGLLDLRASFDISNIRISAYVTNVLKQDYRRTVNALGNTIVGFAGQPRMYGLKVGYRF
ncbi:TonB-dependent receptor [Sphingomonas koreensis]|uniref:TonB-dependent receptor n=2 Tax=Sphingomonas koreensis TaxID=93064 RepID=A0A430FZP1_9SPHN|nr:TonB-dependent receptor [Sphingomonas koreensis]